MAKKKERDSESGYLEAWERIEACRKSQRKYLDLRGLRLKTLPKVIGHITSLTELKLDNNQLRFLTPEIGRLTALTHLSVS
jgi:hypothetical protein